MRMHLLWAAFLQLLLSFLKYIPINDCRMAILNTDYILRVCHHLLS